MAIFDAMQFVPCADPAQAQRTHSRTHTHPQRVVWKPGDVSTVCYGMAASMGAFLLGAGSPFQLCYGVLEHSSIYDICFAALCDLGVPYPCTFKGQRASGARCQTLASCRLASLNCCFHDRVLLHVAPFYTACPIPLATRSVC